MPPKARLDEEEETEEEPSMGLVPYELPRSVILRAIKSAVCRLSLSSSFASCTSHLTLQRSLAEV